MDTRTAFLATSAIALGLLGHPILSQAYDDAPEQRQVQHCQRFEAGEHRHGWRRLAERLHLSREQRQSMRAIFEKYRPQLRELRHSLADNRQALEKMDAGDAGLQDAAAAQGKTLAALIVARKQMRSEMKQVLTEEQRQTLRGLLERREHMRHHEMRRD